MAEFNVTMNFEDDDIDKIVDVVIEKVDIEDQIETWVDNNMNVDDLISDWMGSNFDLADYMDQIDIHDYINDSEIDGEEIARNLLESYNPTNACTTGEAFTEAVFKAIRYLLLEDDSVAYIVKAIERYNRHQIKNEIREQLKNELKDEIISESMGSIWAEHLSDFNRQLARMTTPERQIYIENIVNDYQQNAFKNAVEVKENTPDISVQTNSSTQPHINYGY